MAVPQVGSELDWVGHHCDPERVALFTAGDARHRSRCAAAVAARVS